MLCLPLEEESRAGYEWRVFVEEGRTGAGEADVDKAREVSEAGDERLRLRSQRDRALVGGRLGVQLQSLANHTIEWLPQRDRGDDPRCIHPLRIVPVNVGDFVKKHARSLPLAHLKERFPRKADLSSTQCNRDLDQIGLSDCNSTRRSDRRVMR